MRVLHVVPSYLPAWRYGGLIHSVHGLCKALAQRGHDVEVFTTNVDGENETDVPIGEPVGIDGVRITYFRSPLLRRLYWSPAMRSALRRRVASFAILHLHSIYLWPTWSAARAARRVAVPYVVAPRGMLVKELVEKRSRWIKTAWLSLLERATVESADAIHFTSPLEKDEADRFGWHLPRPFVVPNGIDPPAQTATSNGDYVLFVGRINWKKGLDRLIDALSLVRGVRLVIAGNDEERERPKLEARAREKGVAERVEFKGYVAGEEKQDLYRRAIALVLPSLSENFGNVVLEAMAVGCPVIVTPAVGLADVVQQREAGLVTSGDPQSLAAAIARLRESREMRLAMGTIGRQLVLERFTWDVVAAQMEAAYRQIIR